MCASGMRAKYILLNLHLLYKIIFILFIIFHPCNVQAQDTLRLSPPQTATERIFAGPFAFVIFDFRLTGAVIRYTTDGTEPSGQSPVYEKPVPALKPGFIKARAFCPGFLPSRVKTVTVLAHGAIRIDSICGDLPSAQYNMGGLKSLHDSLLGSMNLHQHWLGYNQPSFTITVYPDRRKKNQSVVLSLLQRQDSWIFMPQKISISDGNGNVVGATSFSGVDTVAADDYIIARISIKKKKYRQLNIKVEALPALPGWHAGKGSVGWVFVDEVMLW
jgi:hypothetical protein